MRVVGGSAVGLRMVLAWILELKERLVRACIGKSACGGRGGEGLFGGEWEISGWCHFIHRWRPRKV